MSVVKTPKIHLDISDLFQDEDNFLENLKNQEINKVSGGYMGCKKYRKHWQYCCRGYLKGKGFLNVINVIVND